MARAGEHSQFIFNAYMNVKNVKMAARKLASPGLSIRPSSH